PATSRRVRGLPARAGKVAGAPAARLAAVLRSLQRLFRRRAYIIQLALRALWFSGHADGPTVRDQPMREDRPLLLRDELHEVLLDLHRIEMRGEAQAAGNARDMSIDHHADGDVERVSQNDVGCLASDA